MPYKGNAYILLIMIEWLLSSKELTKLQIGIEVMLSYTQNKIVFN